MKKSMSLEDAVKNFFSNNKTVSIKSKLLAKKLKVTNETEYLELKAILYSLAKEGFLGKNGKRYKFSSSGNLITGKIIISRKGYGFVTPLTNPEYDIFIPLKYLNNAITGDIVTVKLLNEYKGKNPTGEVVKIIERVKTEFTGNLKSFNNKYYVIPDDPQINYQIEIPVNKLNKAKDGDKVVISLNDDQNYSGKLTGYITDIFGKAGSHISEMLAIAHSYNLPVRFPKNVEDEVTHLTEEIIAEELINREDIRNKNVITIDPADAKDFDDALSIEKLDERTYLAGVHIADVSFFVKENSKTDLEARKRGTSVYLVNYVVPMLPEVLTNNLCSLVPGKDRLCSSVFIKIDNTGKVKDYYFSKTVIRSKRRFSYEEAEDVLDKNGDMKFELDLLNELAQKLFKERIKKGSIDFASDEVLIILDESGKTTEIKPKKKLKSHSLIEEFMLLANKLVAQKCSEISEKNNVPFVYRVHDYPDEKKLMELFRFVSLLGYKFNTGGKIKNKHLQQLIEKVKGKPEENLVGYEMIRSMAKAVYSTENIGHYGLAFPKYTHFTSPIRRYPDLMAHRLLFKYLKGNFTKRGIYTEEKLEEICNTNSESEKLAANAEREAIKTKVIEFLMRNTKAIFKGIISGVQPYGIFIELTEYHIEGLLSIENMPSDNYYFDEKKYALIGQIDRTEFRLGDEVYVRIKRINPLKKEIDFELEQ